MTNTLHFHFHIDSKTISNEKKEFMGMGSRLLFRKTWGIFRQWKLFYLIKVNKLLYLSKLVRKYNTKSEPCQTSESYVGIQSTRMHQYWPG